MEVKKIADVLSKHKLWLEKKAGGKRADLTGADLTGADLTGADLTGADLTGADLTWANLTRANLTGANLTEADLTGANIDFSCWPLWCGSIGVKIDRRILAQLAYHLCAVECDDQSFPIIREGLRNIANEFHRINGEFIKPIS